MTPSSTFPSEPPLDLRSPEQEPPIAVCSSPLPAIVRRPPLLASVWHPHWSLLVPTRSTSAGSGQFRAGATGRVCAPPGFASPSRHRPALLEGASPPPPPPGSFLFSPCRLVLPLKLSTFAFFCLRSLQQPTLRFLCSPFYDRGRPSSSRPVAQFWLAWPGFPVAA
jgi:hypothetical protein